ncbi:hypothetical protein C823_004389 [Eubacterium plexicaudatum ASF492]|nr:hypothetical protein C823_004389 [Eubacterium plexicaudatum ASF492]
MDIRMEKTEKAIKNAFMELRSKKPPEKITVKELCRLACINKSTFYSHYEDIYALSERMETETVESVLKSIPHAQQYTFENLDVVARELCLAFISHLSLIQVLFSGKGHSYLADKLEKKSRKRCLKNIRNTKKMRKKIYCSPIVYTERITHIGIIRM